MASYQELKSRLAKPTSLSTGSSKSVSYADLKQKVSPLIANANARRKQQEEERQRQLQEEQARLEAERNKPTFLQKAGTFGKELVQGIGRGLVRPAISLAELPLNIATGGAKTFGDVNVPGLGQVQSYQEATRRAQEKVISGEKPLLSVLAPGAEAVLDVAGLGIGGSVAKTGIKTGIKEAFKAGAKEGAIYGAGYGGVQAAEEGKGLKESAKTIAVSTALGGLLAGGLGAGVSKISRRIKPEELTSTIDEVENILGSKLTSDETKQVVDALGKGKKKEDIVNAIKQTTGFEQKPINVPENLTTPQIPENLQPKTLKPGELAPTVQRIESQTEKLTPSKALEVKNALETGYSEESIIKSLQDTGEVIPKAVETPKLTPETPKPQTPIQIPKESGTYYRGEGGSNVAQGKALLAEGKHFAMDSEYPKGFGRVSEYIEKPNAKVFEIGDLTYPEISEKLGIPKRNYISPKEMSKILKEKGYDIFKYTGEYKSTGKPFTHTVELTDNAFIPKSPSPIQTEQIAKQGEAKAIKIEVEAGKSKFAQRLNDELPDNLKIDDEYDVAHLKGETDKAAKLIETDQKKALNIALGKESAPANTQTATSIMLAEKAKIDGDWETVAQLYNNRRIANTRRGQEIAMEKLSIKLNPEEVYMREVVNARLNGVKLGTADIAEALSKKSKTERVMTRVKKDSATLKESLTKAVKIEKAQKVFNDIICK